MAPTNRLLQNRLLRFRAPEPEDLDLFYRWENDTSLWEHGPTIAPVSRFVLREYLKCAKEDIYATGQLRLMIETVGQGVAIGTVDLFDFDPYNNRAFIGMLIDPAEQGKGYGQAAVELLVEYCFSHLHLHQLCVHIPLSNKPCYRLYQKMGFSLCGILKEWIRRESYYEDVYFMQLLNERVHKAQSFV